MFQRKHIDNITFNLQHEEEEEVDLLEEMSKEWFLTQMKHHVSAAATNSFWDIAFKNIPLVLQQRRKKVPKFIQQRRKIKQNYAPPIHIEFNYLNLETNEVEQFRGSTEPVKACTNNPKYEKLYEVAHVKVCKLLSMTFT